MLSFVGLGLDHSPVQVARHLCKLVAKSCIEQCLIEEVSFKQVQLKNVMFLLNFDIAITYFVPGCRKCTEIKNAFEFFFSK